MSNEDTELMLDGLKAVLCKNIKNRLSHLANNNIVGSSTIFVELDELGVTVTAYVASANAATQIHTLHLKFRKAIAAEFKVFIDAGARMPNLSIAFITRK